MTSVTSGSAANAAISGPGSGAAARMSMSPMVSRIRRSDPAYVQRWQPATAEIAATISSARPAATSMSARPSPPRVSSMPWRRFSSVLGPKPRRPASRPSSSAATSSSTEAMPRSWYRTHGLLGARGRGSRSAPARRRGSSRAASPPRRSTRCVKYSWIFSAMDAPTPGIFCSSLTIQAGDVGVVPGHRPGRLLVDPLLERLAAGDGEQVGVLLEQRRPRPRSPAPSGQSRNGSARRWRR